MSCLTFLKHDTNVIGEALKVLGKENLALIVHGSSFPARDGEDTGFGSFNSESGHTLISYASKIFNAIQLGPAGKTKCTDSSPYCGTIFSGNPLFIDLKQLTTKEWGEILSLEAYKKVVRENPKQNQARTSYSYICKAQNEALKEAWNNFKGSKLLKKEFEKFKKENAYWLDNDALYEALSIENGGDQQPAATAEPVSEPTSEPEPTPEPTPEITYPVDVTKDMKTEMKELSTRIRPFLAFCASYYERGRHAFKWDDMSASTMALYNLQYLDKTVKYGTPIDTIMKKTKKEVKNLFGKNAKCRFTYSGRFPDYVFVKTGNTMVYNVTRITGKTYSMKTDKVIEYKEGKYRLIVSAGLVSERNKKDKGYFQKYTVYVEKDESAKYGFVIKKIALYKKKDGKTA